jgi:ABC-type multidrug transport system ATPase subunit
MIMGITEPDSGRIDYEGLEPTDITMMSQRPYLMHANVYDNIVYPLKIRGQQIDAKKIDELLERVGLLEIKDQYAGSLSSGERQKLSFLRAIVFRPKMILMDETLSNLDQESEALFKEMILERHREDGSTWLIVSHQWDEMNDLFDKVHHMEKGRIVK